MLLKAWFNSASLLGGSSVFSPVPSLITAVRWAAAWAHMISAWLFTPAGSLTMSWATATVPSGPQMDSIAPDPSVNNSGSRAS